MASTFSPVVEMEAGIAAKRAARDAYHLGSAGGATPATVCCGLHLERHARVLFIALVAAVVTLVVVTVAFAAVAVRGSSESGSQPPPVSPPDTSLAGRMNVSRVLATLSDLQGIAMAHNGSRSVWLGYNASAAYIMGRIAAEAPEYTVTQQFFPMQVTQFKTPPTLVQTAPTERSYPYPGEFLTMGNEGGGTASAQVYSVPQMGCLTSDFAAAPSGHIMLIKRGNCTFRVKVDNAQAAGAAGILIYNDGLSEDRTGVIYGTLGEPPSTVPVFGVSWGDGVGLADLASVTAVRMNMSSSSHAVTAVTSNIIVDMDAGSADNVVVVGSHLDSVNAGPGINDNGSGSATNLELLLQFARLYLRAPAAPGTVKARVRFCFWGAEEEGLIGSDYYIKHLPASEIAKLVVKLNFDMLGSPNFIRGVLDGAGAPPAIRPASVKLRSMFESALANQSLTSERVPFTGRSDYGPFLLAGVPAGGLDTGAEVIKTVAQRAKFGGLANTPFDPCYHQSCDTVDNINVDVLGQMGVAAATVLQQLALSPDVRALLASP